VIARPLDRTTGQLWKPEAVLFRVSTSRATIGRVQTHKRGQSFDGSLVDQLPA